MSYTREKINKQDDVREEVESDGVHVFNMTKIVELVETVKVLKGSVVLLQVNLDAANARLDVLEAP